MAWKQTIEAYELLDGAAVRGETVAATLQDRGMHPWVHRVDGQRGTTDFVGVRVQGSEGCQQGGAAPTLGIIGGLGGIGGRPDVIGLVSDADGAVTAIAYALKLSDMAGAGDRLPGDVMITTHICPRAPVIPHDPVPMMGAPIDMDTMNRHEVHPDMDAILSVYAIRGNWVISQRRIAISPTVKEGYILRPSPDLLQIQATVTGPPPVVLPIATHDIRPYGNGLDHLNSIMQPATTTDSPVVGVALSAETIVPGCASGASQVADIEVTVRFCIEVAKALGSDRCRFYHQWESDRIVALYGSMVRFQTGGLGIED